MDEKLAYVVLTGPMWYWSADEWYEAMALLMSERAPA